VKALLIGGGGPTGPFIVEELRRRGYRLAVLNRGVHPADHSADVEQIIADPHFAEPLQEAIGGRTFDVVVASYGRLRVIAEVLAGRTGRLVAAGGFALYRGWHDVDANFPAGLPVSTREDAPIVTDPEENRFASLIARSESVLFEHHPEATVLRYPYIYGPRQIAPREWSIVRRVLDGRRTMILVDGGRGLMTHGYAANIAHAMALAVDKPEIAGGKAYNCGDEIQLTQRQLVEVAAAELGVELECVSIPNGPSVHMVATLRTAQHQLMDISRLRTELGYRDVVPTIEAVRRTIRWYVDNPLERGGEYESRVGDPFDYDNEDRVITLARAFASDVAALTPDAEAFVHPYAHPDKPGVGRDQRGR
jgi:nucleoside-diphosphate-sugar epimerase